MEVSRFPLPRGECMCWEPETSQRAEENKAEYNENPKMSLRMMREKKQKSWHKDKTAAARSPTNRRQHPRTVTDGG